jgi:hypothetical protein
MQKRDNFKYEQRILEEAILNNPRLKTSLRKREVSKILYIYVYKKLTVPVTATFESAKFLSFLFYFFIRKKNYTRK